MNQLIFFHVIQKIKKKKVICNSFVTKNFLCKNQVVERSIRDTTTTTLRYTEENIVRAIAPILPI